MAKLSFSGQKIKRHFVPKSGMICMYFFRGIFENFFDRLWCFVPSRVVINRGSHFWNFAQLAKGVLACRNLGGLVFGERVLLATPSLQTGTPACRSVFLFHFGEPVKIFVLKPKQRSSARGWADPILNRSADRWVKGPPPPRPPAHPCLVGPTSPNPGSTGENIAVSW